MTDEKLLPPIFGEISDESRTRAAFVGELAESRDEVLRIHGNGDLSIYERLLRDDQVHATFQQRRTSVVSLPWIVEPGGPTPRDEEAADFLREQLKRSRWDQVTWKMLSGIFYGYAVAEMIYEEDRGRVGIQSIKVRRAKRFRFDRAGQLILLDPDRGRVPMPAQKFWTYTAGADDDDDFYGLGLGYYLYWPVWFKRNGWRFWSLWLEKLASGTPIAKGPPGMTPGDEDKLLDVLKAITNGGRVVVPKNVEVEILESMRSSGGDYDAFAARMDRAISKIVMSQTMTTDDGSSLAQANVHARVGGKVTLTDADLIHESFNEGPARWLTEWNFPGAATPVVWRDGADPEDLSARATRDAQLASIGYRPTEQYIRDTYGEGFEFVSPVAPSNDSFGPSPFGGFPSSASPATAPTPEATSSASPAPTNSNLVLAPTDIAKVVTVNEARAAQGLGELRKADGSRDDDGELTIAEFNALRESQREAMGKAVGEAQGEAEAADEFAEAETEVAEPNDVASDQLDDGWQKVIEPEVVALEELLSNASSLEDFRARLGEIVNRNPDALTEQLARILFVGKLSGSMERDGGE